MSSQYDLPVSDASAQSRQTGGILTPLSDISLNSNDGALSGGKKRKRDGNTMEDLLKDPFVVRPYPSAVPGRPRTFHPLVLLPRSQVPLSYLDIHSSNGALPPSRLFETHVKILELEERMGNQPMLLIARLDDGRSLFAVEREDRGLYVLCQLGSWVNLSQLRVSAVASTVDLPNKTERILGQTGNKSLPKAGPDATIYGKKKRLAIEALQSMVKRPSTSSLSEPQPSANDHDSMELPQGAERFSGEPAKNEAPVQNTAAEIFDSVRSQYLEALYSKTSLAYFAKGPLSRARAAFHLDYDSLLDMTDYVTFLESLTLTTKMIDKKFSDGLPTCVSLIDVQDHSAVDTNQGEVQKKKGKSSKKMKIAKNGLYPTEESLIRKWWANLDKDMDIGAPGTSREDTAKTRISELRIRETQLQMIVILEVLALRPLASNAEDSGFGLPSGLPSEIPDGKGRDAKHKRANSLTTLIDVHVDRLCIWQDLAAEAGSINPGESQAGNESQASPSNPPKYTDSVLRDFCVEVIGPFFSARLPDRCTTINIKLGGPVVISPPRPKLLKSASYSGSHSRPGAVTKRPIPAKPRERNLRRVLTNEKERERRGESQPHGRGRSISLMRSATAPIIPGLKREASETPSLSSIPTANRPGVLNSKRFSQREVDLSSLAPEVAKSKVAKQALVEAELKEAISALRRPNRDMAGKDIMEAVERRTAAVSQSRKNKKPIRNPFFEGIQISATPRGTRKRDVFSLAKPPTLSEMLEEVEMVAIPPSSLPRVPQSAMKSSIPKQNPFLSAIDATPLRKPMPRPRPSSNLLGVPVVYGSHLPSSPLQARRTIEQPSSAVPDSTMKSTRSDMEYGLEDTPVKNRPALLKYSTAPELSGDKENGSALILSVEVKGKDAKSNQDDIYKSLGWDDGDEIDELS